MTLKAPFPPPWSIMEKAAEFINIVKGICRAYNTKLVSQPSCSVKNCIEFIPSSIGRGPVLCSSLSETAGNLLKVLHGKISVDLGSPIPWSMNHLIPLRMLQVENSWGSELKSFRACQLKLCSRPSIASKDMVTSSFCHLLSLGHHLQTHASIHHLTCGGCSASCVCSEHNAASHSHTDEFLWLDDWAWN